MVERDNIHTQSADTPLSEQAEPQKAASEQVVNQTDLALSTPAGKSITKLLTEKKQQVEQACTDTEADTKAVLNEIEQSCQTVQAKTTKKEQENNTLPTGDTAEKVTKTNLKEPPEDKPKKDKPKKSKAKTEKSPKPNEKPQFGASFSLSMLKEEIDKIRLFFREKAKHLPKLKKHIKEIKLDKKTVSKNGFYCVAGVLILCAVIGLFKHSSVKRTRVRTIATITKPVPVSLSDLKTALDSLTEKTANLSNNTASQADIINQLNALSSALDSLRLHTQSAFSHQAKLSNQDGHAILKKLQQLTKAMESLRLTLQPVHYIDSQQLPFKVLSIDMIEGRAVVSVAYHNSVVPLEPRFHLAGWQLIKASYFDQTAEFIKAATSTTTQQAKLPHIRIALQSELATNRK